MHTISENLKELYCKFALLEMKNAFTSCFYTLTQWFQTGSNKIFSGKEILSHYGFYIFCDVKVVMARLSLEHSHRRIY
jgi:hypothetical protein